MSPPTPTAQVIRVGELTIVIHTPPDFDALLTEAARQTPDDVDAIPYYAALWPSAHALAEELWHRRATLPGQRVLELGCGLGLPSIAAARLGADVTATDFHPASGAWCQTNAAANHVSLNFHPCDWNTPPEWPPFDVVMGSDLVYERRHIPALAACIGHLCKADGLALLADPGRDGLPQLTAVMQSNGWQTELIPCGEIYVLAFTNKIPCR
ncbi:MAG: class I SAM-dependent methyltransferase [Kiritimatiellia bacterium]